MRLKDPVYEPLNYELLQKMVDQVNNENIVIDIKLSGGTNIKIYKRIKPVIEDVWTRGI
jgi:hypothetical protein